MKKISILLFLVCLFVKANAQETSLGMTENEIKTLYNFYSFTTGYSDGKKYIKEVQEYGQTIYFFDETGICNFCTYIPNSTKDLIYAISLYNKDCIIIDKTHWKEIIKGKTYFIRLATKAGITSFTYTLIYMD